MYKKNHSFHTPDSNTIIWRYIDFTKLIDLLVSGQLFFARSDKFDDPQEGIFKLKDFNETSKLFLEQPITKKYYFLNCWHINEVQSDAMWKIFLKTNNGVAIKSTIGSLIKSLEKERRDIYISKVYYRDFEKVTFPELMSESQNKIFDGRGSSINQFNYKRINFEHEKELRLYFIDMPIPHVTRNKEAREPLEYIRIDVSLMDLVDEIIVSPFSERWLGDLITKTTKKLGFDFSISKSTLYDQ